MLCAVLCGALADVLLELLGEIIDIAVADLLGDLVNSELLVGEHLYRVVDADAVNIGVEAVADGLCEYLAEL